MSDRKTLLQSKEEFDDYKWKLDRYWHVTRYPDGYAHRHSGDPEEYPCMVMSKWWDDPNGPYSFDHSFIYVHDIEPLLKYYLAKEFEEEVL